MSGALDLLLSPAALAALSALLVLQTRDATSTREVLDRLPVVDESLRFLSRIRCIVGNSGALVRGGRANRRENREGF